MTPQHASRLPRARWWWWLCWAAPLAMAEPLPDALQLAEPPQARPGECWAQWVEPARFERHSESVLVTPETTRLQTIPARYEWVEQPEHRPAGKRRVVVRPAEYEVTEQTVDVTPAGSRQRTLRPAQYETVEERVATRTGTVLKPDPITGEMCAVEGPVEYQIVRRQRQITPAERVSEPVAAVTRTVRQRRLVTPAETRWVNVPERTVMRRVRQLVEPERQISVPVPAVYEMRERLVQVAPAQQRWVSVICDTNATPELLRRVQTTLGAAGHDPGTRDGRWGRRSSQALAAYQRASGLTPAGLTVETLQALGVAER